MAKKAMIAMSGGVDSSVAAYLMQKAGYDCVGVTMKLFDINDTCKKREKACSAGENEKDAKSVADRLGIPYKVIDLQEDFEKAVIDPFVNAYLCGMTPNPCVECNRRLKFRRLYDKGREMGCDLIVTGHYARVTEDAEGFHLLKGRDPGKDQSYVLYALTPEQLSHTCFPLGEYSKEEIRRIAAEQGFINADRPESQDICFIPDGDYRAFIEARTGKACGPGDFVNTRGEVVGTHKGYYAYTIGQRRGLGISAPAPYYVTEILPEENIVRLGSNEDLFHSDLIADGFNWIEKVEPDEPVRARIRYHQKETEARVSILEDGRVAVHFLSPVRAITAGQSVVLYKDDHVAGGGTIVSVG